MHKQLAIVAAILAVCTFHASAQVGRGPIHNPTDPSSFLSWFEALQLDGTNMIYVAKNGDDADDGHSPQRPKLTITSALTEAASYFGGSPGVIHVGAGTWDEDSLAWSTAGTLLLRGEGRGVTRIESDADGPVFDVQGANTVIAYVNGITFDNDGSGASGDGLNCLGITTACSLYVGSDVDVSSSSDPSSVAFDEDPGGGIAGEIWIDHNAQYDRPVGDGEVLGVREVVIGKGEIGQNYKMRMNVVDPLGNPVEAYITYFPDIQQWYLHGSTVACSDGFVAGNSTNAASSVLANTLGTNCYSYGDYSLVGGRGCIGSNDYVLVWGRDSIGAANYSRAGGNACRTEANYSIAEGNANTASGVASRANGSDTVASGNYSATDGYQTSAGGLYSKADGSTTVAAGLGAYAGGNFCHASNSFSRASGEYAYATNNYAFIHAKGTAGTKKYTVMDDAGHFDHVILLETVPDRGDAVADRDYNDTRYGQLAETNEWSKTNGFVAIRLGGVAKNAWPIGFTNLAGVLAEGDDAGGQSIMNAKTGQFDYVFVDQTNQLTFTSVSGSAPGIVTIDGSSNWVISAAWSNTTNGHQHVSSDVTDFDTAVTNAVISEWANLAEADTFFGATDISGAEAETLTDGSNADALHTHTCSGIAFRYMNYPAVAMNTDQTAAGPVFDTPTNAYGGITCLAFDNNSLEWAWTDPSVTPPEMDDATNVLLQIEGYTTGTGDVAFVVRTMTDGLSAWNASWTSTVQAAVGSLSDLDDLELSIPASSLSLSSNDWAQVAISVCPTGTLGTITADYLINSVRLGYPR